MWEGGRGLKEGKGREGGNKKNSSFSLIGFVSFFPALFFFVALGSLPHFFCMSSHTITIAEILSLDPEKNESLQMESKVKVKIKTLKLN